jgi:hypothetical protein
MVRHLLFACIVVFSFSILFSSSLVLASSPCDDFFACGVDLDSNSGFGAVAICDVCYVCGGVSDDVCPEDFYDSVMDLQASCAMCPDPDCTAELKVTVTDDNSPSFPVTDVDITVTYQNNPPTTRSSTTDGAGETTFEILSGNATITASKNGFAPQVKNVLLNRTNTLQTIAFTNFKEASCTSSCTREGSLYCDPNCQGFEGCNYDNIDFIGDYTSDDVKDRCSYQLNSSKIVLGYASGSVYFANCCTGGISQETRPTIAIDKQTLPISNLMSHVQSLRLNQERVFMVTMVWE